jgi:hypothetical protein
MDLSVKSLDGLKSDLIRQYPSLGQGELEWAIEQANQGDAQDMNRFSRDVATHLENLRDEVLTKIRPGYYPGSFIALPAETWQNEVYPACEREARERLLASSASMRELTDLERQAKAQLIKLRLRSEN